VCRQGIACLGCPRFDFGDAPEAPAGTSPEHRIGTWTRTTSFRLDTGVDVDEWVLALMAPHTVTVRCSEMISMASRSSRRENDSSSHVSPGFVARASR